MNQPNGRGRKSQPVTWICVADAHRAHLVQCEHTQSGSWTMEQCGELESENPAHRHKRPSPRCGRMGGYPDTQEGQADRDRQRFARRVAAWLKRNINGRRVQRLVLLAPPRFLGALRKTAASRLAGSVDDRPCELTHLKAHRLREHPVFRESLGMPPGSALAIVR